MTFFRLYSKIQFFLALFFSLLITQAIAQTATVVNNGSDPRHETLSQQLTSVLFDNGAGVAITLTGSTPTTDWALTVNGTPITTTATLISSNKVLVTFNASAAHVGLEPYLLPGDVLLIKFTNSGTLKTGVSGNAALSFSGVQSHNKWVAACGDVAFDNQGAILLPVTKTPDICSPVVEDFTQYQFFLSLRVRNSTSYTSTGFGNVFVWGDGTANTLVSAYTSDINGVASATYTNSNAPGLSAPAVIMTTRPSHTYPATLPGTGGDCSWNASITPVLNYAAFITCTGALGQSTNFPTYDTDNANTGALSFPANVLGTDQVCLGSNVNMQFKDATTLNCNVGIEPLVPNQQTRYIRLTYGSTNYASGNIPDVFVTLPASLGGATVQITNNDATGSLIYPSGYYPTTGVADGNGVITLPSPVTTSTLVSYSGTITTLLTANQVVGQRFYVQLEYWDVCNPYDGTVGTLGASVKLQNYVQIISKPPVLTASPLSLCYAASTAGQTFTVTGTTGSTNAVHWYNKNPKLGGATLMTNSIGTNSATFKLSDYTVANAAISAPINTSQAGNAGIVYSVWATQVYGATNSCESDPVEVVLTVRPKLPTPGAITGTTALCVGSTGIAYSVAAASATQTIGVNSVTNTAPVSLATNYLWSFSNGDGTVTSSTTIQAIIANLTIAGTTNIQVLDQYSSPSPGAPTCNTANSTLTITIDPTTVGGSVTPNNTICDDGVTKTGLLTLGGQTGAVQKWQRSLDGGTTWTDLAFTTTTFQELPSFGPGTYMYRAVVKSGTCLLANSSAATITVNPVPPQPTISQTGASTGLTICADGTQKTVLQSSNVGGVGVSYQWYRNGTAVAGQTASTITLNTVAQSGTYTVTVIGVAPSACTSTPSNGTLVTINPLPSAANPTGGGAVCSGNPAPDINWVLTGTAPFTVIYTMTPGGPVTVNNWPSNTFTITAPNPGVSTTYQITSLTDANTCVGTSLGGTASVTIGGTAPTFAVGGNPVLASASACNAGALTTDPQVNFTLNAASASTINFTLNYTVDASTNRTKTFNTNAASQPTPAITFSDAELNVVGSHTIKIVSIQSAAGCLTVFNTPLTFTVNPLPVLVTPQTKTICSGVAVNYEILLTPANTPAGTSFTWPVPTVSAGPAQGTAKTIAADPAGTLHITDVLTNTTGAALTVTYAITPTSSLGCPGTPQNVVITVNPAPVIVAGQTKTICSGSAVNLEVLETPANAPAGTVFNWAVPTVSAGPAQGTAGSIAADPAGKKHLTDVLTNTTGAPITVTYKITPTSSSGCAGTQVPVVITVNPAPVITAGQTKTICSGSAVNLEVLETPANLPAGTTFNWAAPTVSAGPAQGTAKTIAADPAGTLHITDVLTNVTGSNITVTYKITPTSAAGCAGTQVPVVITVEPAPNIVAGQTKSICSGQNTSYEILLSPLNAPTGTIFTWPDPDGGGPATSGNIAMGVAGTKHIKDVLTNGTSAPITVTYQITATSGAGCVGTTQNVVITVNPLPVANPISGPPTVCSGSSIQFYQSTSDAGATYAWTVPPLFTKFAGGTSGDFYVLLQFPTVGSGTLQMTETNSYGCSGSVNSLPITVSSAPGAIVVTGPQQVCSGDTKTYQVVSNPSSNFSWVVTTGNASITPPASGPNLFSISVIFGSVATPVTLQVTETSSSGCVGAPVNYPITMNNVPAMNSSSTSTTCSGVAPSLVFTSTNGTSNYSWSVVSITGSLTGVTASQTGSGNLSSTFTGASAIRNVSGAVGSVTFNVNPTSTTTPFCQGPTQSVVLTVNPEPVLVTPQTKTICSGQKVNYEILLSPLNLPALTTFSWPAPVMSDLSSQGTAQTNVADGPAGTIHIADVLVNNTASAITATYTITPTSGTGCPGTPRTVVITINPQPVLSSSLNATVCSGSHIGLTLTTAVGSAAANNYNITSLVVPAGLTAGTNATVPATAVGSTYLSNDSYLNTTNGPLTVNYTVVPVSAAGCTGSPVTINITVNPQPSLSSTLDMTLCSGVATGLTLTTTGTSTPAIGYNITGITVAGGLVAGGSNAIVPASNQAPNYLAGDVFTNTGSTALTVVYQVVPVSAMLCPGDPPKSITITVNPEPVIGNSNSSVCSGNPIALTLTTNGTSVAAASYNITNSVVAPGLIAGGSNAHVPQSGVPAGYLNADVYTNTTGAALTVTYTVVPVSATPCSGQSKVITITINPQPVMSTALNATVCSDNATGLTLNTNGTSVAAANYNITSRAISGGLTPNIANAAVPATAVSSTYLSNDIFTNTGANPLTVTYTVVPVSSSGCLGSSKIITITINPEPVVSNSLDATVCSIVPIGLNLNTNGSSVAASTYNITAVVVAGGLVAGSNATVPASNVGAAYLATDTYSNTGTTSLTVTYTVVPISAAGCLGNPKVITLTVSPEPVVSNTLNATVCSQAASGLTLNTNGTSVAAANYNVTLISVATGLTPAVTNAVIPATNVVPTYLNNDKFTNTGNTSLPVVYTVVPLSAAGCPGPSKQITITINPEPVVSTGLNTTVCSGVSTGLTLNTNGSSVAAATYNITSRTIAGGLTPGGTNASVPNTGIAANYLTNDAFTNTTTLPLNVTYTVVGISSSGCVGQPQVITVSINPAPVLSTTLNATLCSSTATNLTLNTNGTSVAAASYNVTNISLAAGLSAEGTNAVIPFTGASNTYLSGDKFINTTTNPLTATYTIVPVSAANCAGNPVNVVMTINPEPVISTLLNETVCSDVATGLILNTNGISVAALNYNITARSIAAGLTPAGTNAGFPATAVAANYLANDKFTNVTNNPLTVTYTVVAMSGATCVGQPRTITVTINPKPVLSGSLNLTQCSEVTTGLVLNTNGTSVAAQNYNITVISMAAGLTAAGTNASIPATGVNASYLGNDSFTNTGSGNLNVVYTVVPVSASGCAGVPMPVTVTIQPQAVVSTTLSNTVCSGQVIGLTLATNGTSIAAANYTIISRTISGGLVASAPNAAVPAIGVVPGYLANDVYTNTTNSALTVTYTVVAVSAAGCQGDPQIITMTINPEPVVSSTLNNSVCSGTSIGLTLNTNGSSVGAANYSITASVVSAGLTAAGTNVTSPASNVSASYLASNKFTNTGNTPLTVTYTVVPFSSAGCQGQPKVITITINPEPVIASGLDKSICSSIATGLTLNTNGTSVGAASYNIVSITVGGTLTASGTNAVVPNTGVTNSYLSLDVFKNIANSSQTVSYVVVPVSGLSCVGVAKTITITVNPEPVGSNVTDPQCATTLNHSIQSQITNGVTSVFTYTVSSDNVGVPAAANRTVASAASITDVYTNNSGVPANLTYTITPFSSANNCQGASFTYVVTISPTPVGANSTQAALCSRSAISINPQSKITNGVTATFTWTAVYDVNLTGGTGSGNGTITDNLTNLTANTLNATYTVTPTSGPCPGASFTIIQPINPEPVMDPSLAVKTICSNNATSSNPVNITLNTNGVSVAATSYNVSLVSQDAGLTGTPTTGAALGTNAIKNDVFNNTGPVPLKVVYQIIPKSASGCTGQPFTITVTVNPEPVVAVLSNTVCSKDVSNITLATNGASVGAASYQLIAVTVPGTITANGGNKANLGLPQTGGVALITNDIYTNKTSGPVIVTYSILAISGSGCVGQPQNISLTINPEPILVPGAVSVCSGVAPGAAINLGTAVGSAAITQYNLKKIFVPDSLTAAGTNAGLGNYTVNTFLGNDKFTNVTKNSWQVTYTIAPVAGTCVGDDYSVVLTVNPAPALDNLNATVCSNTISGIVLKSASTSVLATSFNITNVAIAAGLTQTAGNTGVRSGVASGEIQNDKFTNTTNGTLTVTYTIVPITGGCKGPSKNVVLTVEPTITANPVAPSDICSNTALNKSATNFTLNSPSVPTAGPITFSYTAVASNGGLTSGFVRSATNLSNPTTINDSLVNLSSSPSHVTYTVTPVANGARGGAGCSGTPITITVTVEPKPKLTASPSIQTVCEGVASNISLNSTTTPTTGTIQFNVVSVVADMGLTLTSAPVAVYNNGQSITDVWKNDSTDMKTVTYILQPVISGGLGCLGDKVTITLNVNPSPNVTSTIIDPTLAPPAICSNDLVNISLTADVSSTVNTWTAAVTSGTARGFANGSGDLIFETLQNTSSGPANVRYIVTPKASGCVGSPIVINIEVDPIPNISFTAPSYVCYGATLNVPLTSAVTGTNFNWIADPNNSGVPTAVASGTVINQVIMDTVKNVEDFLLYTITAVGPGATACTSNAKFMNIIASPKMSAAMVTDSLWVCLSNNNNRTSLSLNTQGEQPFTMHYTDGTSNFTVSNFPGFISIQPTVSTTYTLTSMKDALGCTIPLTSSTVVSVDEGNANFSIVSALAACTPDATSFQYNQKAGDSYTWQWGDGTSDSTYTASSTVSGKIVKHRYINSSLTNSIKPVVFLHDTLSRKFPAICGKQTQNNNLVVYAQLKTSVSADKSVICSGDVVNFTNQTVGQGSGNSWFYRYQGNATQQLDPKTSINVNYTLSIDSTMTNPQIMEVVYHATNGHCPADTVIQITVYKSITASFTDIVPFFVGGNATVTFNNTSRARVDWSQFRFDWDFGIGSSPATLTSSSTPISVNYSSPGSRDVTLVATNIAAAAAGLTCSSTVTQTITILLAPLIAEFKINPNKACYPSKITVTENLSTGDRFKWAVVDELSRDTVSSSNTPFPVFSISSDGSYIVSLITSSSFTGQTASDTAHLILYPKPEAIFDAFPTTVYIPDQAVTTINGSGGTANQYLWDFGDGGTSTDFQPTHTYKIEGVDSLKFTAQYDHGSGIICSATNFKIVVAKQGGVAKIPNAFTPSTAGPSGGVGGVDLYNYVFLPQVKGVEEFNMQIYDRWGNLIFESLNQTIGWDGYDKSGRLMPAGVYVYKLTLRLSDQQRTTQVGDVTLIR